MPIIAGKLTIAAVLMTEVDPSKVFEMQLIENAIRSDLKPVEQGRAFRRLMDQNGWSALKLGERLQISESTIIRALALRDLPEPVQAMVGRSPRPWLMRCPSSTGPTSTARYSRIE